MDERAPARQPIGAGSWPPVVPEYETQILPASNYRDPLVMMS
jgi:hypothetical protein